ncbi:tyrosine--tRNA ligase [Candidatus Absconditicoccus praedator]|uniref:tyrosine--tRNA ligase n=1 Tax=Candidatus Absconditicoccus praedator TaxID=2735562 RepID=UPI001E2F1B60|nr:tyrosine--tRNA ligase [Candidatus Absconditicoccus praedator]UFX82884.1 tyrosine--tRNA ligase [Candidatus Absconditicoccus praedator]
MHLKDILEKKGLLYQYSNEKVFDIYDKGGQTLYFGVDPTADSMHIGHFTVFMNALNYMLKGNKLILIVGGATGMIGDPSGKDSERNFLDKKQLDKNVDSLSRQMSNIISNLEKLTGKKLDFEIINNHDFYENMTFLDFLRDAGKYITVNNMMNKETVKPRIEDPEKSISYTEFSYMLIQAYDFVKLYKEKDCKLQICGSDQWGNGVTGIELIRKILDKESYVVSAPLILDSSGKKFGKSEGNAIWLDENKSSPYFVYQYFMNCTDEDVERFLKIYTILDFEEIDKIVDTHKQAPENRYGQAMLAKNVVRTVFGEKQSIQAEKISEVMFGKKDKKEIIKSMDEEEIKALKNEIGGIDWKGNIKITEALSQSGLTASNSEAKKMIKSGAVYLNEEKVEDIEKEITDDDLINGKIALLRKGKKNYKIIS